jgi:hypothetical protein
MNDRPRLRWPFCRPECRTWDPPNHDVLCSADNKSEFDPLSVLSITALERSGSVMFSGAVHAHCLFMGRRDQVGKMWGKSDGIEIPAFRSVDITRLSARLWPFEAWRTMRH